MSGVPIEGVAGDMPVVHFPLPEAYNRPTRRGLWRLVSLLPRRWRRRVVIAGTRFWAPR